MSQNDSVLEGLHDVTPFENYVSSIRDKSTKKKYAGQLAMFLNPNYDWELPQQKRNLLPENEFALLVNNFVDVMRNDPNTGKNKIKRYVMSLKKQIDEKSLNPNTSRNRLKPIKSLLRANEIDFSWYLIDKMMPKETKSQDRAYTRVEIQKMIVHCEDITDKVIITGFSAASFRLEAWDYLTWSDVVFFKNTDGTYKGGALRIYHGDVEEYWTHITPEFCNLLDLYKVYWKSKFFAEPLSSDPLLAQERLPYPARLKHGGISRRVKKIVEHLGLRDNMIPGKQRYEVQLDHGFRKYFNTMLRRAKVDFADKEDMMGHKIALESSYERYEEDDFERFSEYQKAIPFLTISDEERIKHKLVIKEQENSELVNTNEELEKKYKENNSLQEQVLHLQSKMQSYEKQSDMQVITKKDLSDELKNLLQKNPELFILN